MRALRVVFYAVNGTGVGHVTRLAAIARWMRWYAAHARTPLEAWFLTSSEADGLLFRAGFASFKIPSKTSIADAGIDRRAYVALAKQWVWHTLGLLRPDLLVVDTFPRGSFGELLSALDLVKRRAFIYRPVRDGFAARADFQAMLPLYDRIVVPAHAHENEVLVPARARERVVYSGPILARERAEAPKREAARARLGLAESAFVVYATAGGGGDPTARALLAAVARAAHDAPETHVLFGSGPLFRGAPLRDARSTWLEPSAASDAIAACDVAVSAAGYNAFGELMNAGVPTIFLPQEKPADDQRARAERAGGAGAAIVLAHADAESIAAAVRVFRDPFARARASAAGRALVPRGHARDAAAELLRLVMPERAVEAAEDAIDDAWLSAAARTGMRVDDLLALSAALAGPRAPRGKGLARVTAIALRAAGAGLSAGAAIAIATTAAAGHATAAKRARAALEAISAHA